MAHAIRIYKNGGPEQLKWEEVSELTPGPTEVRVKNTAVGLNFVDTYYRSGLYAHPLPMTPGSEGAGVIEAVGKKVKDFKVGDRVAYADPLGSYAELVLRPADRLVKIPKGISDQVAAAALLKGLTAHYLLRRTFKVQAGDTILVHAAAGGTGQILCQWAKHLGVTVIGVVGTPEKEKLAKRVGCKHVIVTSRESIAERVKHITKGEGVPVVYDGVGKDTFMASLDSLSPFGLLVSFGNASGAVEPFQLSLLAQKGSLYLTRPTLATYGADREDLLEGAKQLFKVIKNGAVKIAIGQTYPLAEAARAQEALENRQTTGSTLLIP